MESRLERLVRELFRLPPSAELAEGAGPGAIEGWDSLGHITLISAIESTYQISISMDELLAIESLGDIRRLLVQKGVSD